MAPSLAEGYGGQDEDGLPSIVRRTKDGHARHHFQGFAFAAAARMLLTV